MTLIELSADEAPVPWSDLEAAQLEYEPKQPEQLLLAALLKLALCDYHFGEMRWRRTARQWFADKSEIEWSFRWTCRHLDIDPERSLYAILHFDLSTIKNLRVLLK